MSCNILQGAKLCAWGSLTLLWSVGRPVGHGCGELNCASVRILAHAHVRVFSRGNERFRAGCKCRAADREQTSCFQRVRATGRSAGKVPSSNKTHRNQTIEHGPHTFGREISKWYGDVISLVFILLLFVKLNQTINKY